MSGIVGCYHLDGASLAPDRIQSLLDAISHRGPDGLHVWGRPGLALGHAALHTTPEARHERWPLVGRDGTVLVADARIDNRDELIAALRPVPSPEGIVTDAALILAAYERWGTDCPVHLVGDFAFVLWDEARGRLVCARDVFGVRPFYYRVAEGQSFAFASEIEPLLAFDESRSALNESWVADYLAGIYATTTDTIYADIVRLPPAHWAVVSPEGLRIERYWTLDTDRELRYASDAEYADAFRARFDEAVRCRLRSPTPVGALLSGGLDSSSIVVTARELTGASSLHTFSTVFDEHPSCDERSYIEAVTEQGGFSSHLMVGDALSPLPVVDELHAAHGQPFVAPNAGLSWKQYAAVRAEGVRVLLDGHGGDEVVSLGEGRLFELARDGRWGRLAREVYGLRRTGRVPSAAALFWAYVWGVGVTPWLYRHPRVGALWGRVQSLWRRCGLGGHVASPADRPWQGLQFLAPAFRERTGVERRYHDIRRRERVPVAERLRHAQVLGHPLQARAFEELGSIAAAHGIEPRYPFWDRRLVEFCLALPPDQKLRRGWERFILRQAMAGRLPAAIQWRATKTNFLPFLHSALLREKETLHTSLFSPLAGEKEYTAETELRDLWRECIESEPDTVSADALFTLWSVVVLNRWGQNRSGNVGGVRGTRLGRSLPQ